MPDQLAEQFGVLVSRVNNQDRIIAKLTNALVAQNEVLHKCKSVESTHRVDCRKVLEHLEPESLVGDSEKSEEKTA